MSKERYADDTSQGLFATVPIWRVTTKLLPLSKDIATFRVLLVWLLAAVAF
jgi:hypothetical protein